MDDKINLLMQWEKNGEDITMKKCCEKLDIKPNQFYHICRKHDINYRKTTPGKMYGAFDKKPRKRRKKCEIARLKMVGGVDGVDVNIGGLDVDAFLVDHHNKMGQIQNRYGDPLGDILQQ